MSYIYHYTLDRFLFRLIFLSLTGNTPLPIIFLSSPIVDSSLDLLWSRIRCTGGPPSR